MPARGTEPSSPLGCWKEGLLQMQLSLPKPFAACVSCCFSPTVHEDVRGGISVPQGGLCGREQASAEQRVLRCQQAAPRDGELRAATLRVRLDHRGVVGGESLSPHGATPLGTGMRSPSLTISPAEILQPKSTVAGQCCVV